MIKKILIILIIILAIFSCSTYNKKKSSKDYFEFCNEVKKIKIINYDILNKKLNLVIDERKFGKTQCISNDTMFLLVRQESYTNNLVVFNFSERTEKILNFDITGYKYFRDYGYINSDSIFLFYDRSEEGYHDRILFLCNDAGNIVEEYSLEEAPILTKKNTHNENPVFLTPNSNEPFVFIDNKIFLQFCSQAEYLGEKFFENVPFAGFIDTKENDKYYPIDIKYPDIEFGKQFYNVYDLLYFTAVGHDGDLLFAFKYTPTIIKYNFKTGVKTEVEIKSSVFDSIYPSLSINDIPNGVAFNMPYPQYFTLQYDKYRNLYYRFVLLPWQYGEMEWGKSNYMLIVADTSFNVVAEGFTFLENNQFELYFTKDFYFNENVCYNMNFKEGTNIDLISQVKSMKAEEELINKPLTHYVKKYSKIKDKNYTAIFMLRDETCENSSNFYYTFFQNNENKFEENEVHLFLVSGRVDELKKELELYNLSPDKHENIIIDSNMIYESYNNSETKDIPRILKVRNNKIVADTIFSVDDGGVNFQNYIILAGKEQMELKEK